MKRFFLRRILLTVPVVLGVATLVFSLIHLIPGDPVDVILGESALPAQREILRRQLGLDKPLTVQYVDFLKGLVRGDLGRSLYSRQRVSQIIGERFPNTVLLGFAAMGVAILIAIPLGIFSALKQYSFIDNLSMFLALLGVSLPNFWLGPMLIIIFALWLDLLPVSGIGTPAHVILPAITLGTAMAAILTRMVRSSLLEVIRDDYMRTAQSKGLTFRWAVIRHALRNAMMPVLTVMGLQAGSILAGSIITEWIFAWPGIGRLTVMAINSRDYPIVQGCVLVIACSYVLVNLITDIAYALLDPRIR
jgi:peptide/nickel transport system permease protein